MTVRSLIKSTCVLTVLALAGSALAQPRQQVTCLDDAMLVFDGSSSMLQKGGDGFAHSRITEARKAVRQVMPDLAPARRLGLVVYGPGRRASCANIDVRFSPIQDAASRVIAEIDAVKPLGSTPLSGAVLKAAKALDYKRKPGVVVLVTDGQETCGSAPCDIADLLAKEGVALQVHVIGFRLKWVSVEWKSEEAQAYARSRTDARCLADKTDGRYVPTETVEELSSALRETLGCAVIG